MEAPPSFPFSRSAAAPDEPPGEFARLRSQPPIKVRLWDGSEPWLIVKHQDVYQALARGDGTVWSKVRRGLFCLLLLVSVDDSLLSKRIVPGQTSPS